MTHRELVEEALRRSDFPLSAYGVEHQIKAHNLRDSRGRKPTPSSVRTRLSELERDKRVEIVGVETSDTGREAVTYALRGS